MENGWMDTANAHYSFKSIIKVNMNKSSIKKENWKERYEQEMRVLWYGYPLFLFLLFELIIN